MKIPIFEYYETLDRKEKKDFRLQTCSRCGLDSSQFYRRMRQDCWSTLEEKEIRSIIEENMRFGM